MTSVNETSRDISRDYILRVNREVTAEGISERPMAGLDYQRRRLEREFENFMRTQTEIIAACTDNNSKAVEMKLVATVDAAYSGLMMLLEMQLTKENATNLDQTIMAIQASTSNKNRKMPDNLTKFDGTHANWPAFRDLFDALVASQDFSDLEKFLCLQKHCLGTAAGVIAGYQPVAASYDTAWAALNSAYEDAYVIAQSFVDKLLDIPVAKNMGAAELRRVIDTMRSTLRQLDTMGHPISQTGALMSNLLARKLPQRLVNEWDQKREQGSFPTFEEFVKFVESKARSRVSYGDSSDRSYNKPSTSTGGATVARDSIGTGSNGLFKTKGSGCFLCGGEHVMVKCSQFVDITDNKLREKKLLEQKLCLNCVGFGHTADKCTRPGCKDSRCSGAKHSWAICPHRLPQRRVQAQVNVIRQKRRLEVKPKTETKSDDNPGTAASSATEEENKQ